MKYKIHHFIDEIDNLQEEDIAPIVDPATDVIFAGNQNFTRRNQIISAIRDNIV